MLKLKSCPRCKGDIIIDRDHLSWYEQCIQCGYQHDLEASGEVKDNGKEGIIKYSKRGRARHGGRKVRGIVAESRT